jgi:hypothetical protein
MHLSKATNTVVSNNRRNFNDPPHEEAEPDASSDAVLPFVRSNRR